MDEHHHPEDLAYIRKLEAQNQMMRQALLAAGMNPALLDALLAQVKEQT